MRGKGVERVGPMTSLTDAELQVLITKLSRQYGEDAAGDAMLALVSHSTPVRNPKAFAARAAWCSMSKRLRHLHGADGTKGRDMLTDSGEPGLGHASSTPGPDCVAWAREVLDRVPVGLVAHYLGMEDVSTETRRRLRDRRRFGK